MSKAAKMGMTLLGVVLLAVLFYTWTVLSERTMLQQAKATLENQIEEFRSREKNQIVENKNLKEQAKIVEEEKARLEEELAKFSDVNIEELNSKIAKLTADRDEWQMKLEGLQQEREQLLAEIEKKPEAQIVYKYLDELGQEVDAEGMLAVQNDQAAGQGLSDGDEVYWAKILKEKTSLELEVEKLRRDLSQSSVQVTELKKKNSDFQLELAKLVNEKEEIERQIKHGKDLSDSLSLELARAQNDKKFLNDRLVKMNDDNSKLHNQIKQLTSTKIALEKSIVRIQDEKKGIERKLMETENVIQGRIDEIWEIKNSLDQSFGSEAKNGNQVELPPIVVSSKEMSGEQDPNTFEAPGLSGNIVSVNNDNNFVIIDIGQEKGVNLGDSLNVYRGAEYIAGLEIIQVRNDIAAADIISKVADIKVGDDVH